MDRWLFGMIMNMVLVLDTGQETSFLSSVLPIIELTCRKNR